MNTVKFDTLLKVAISQRHYELNNWGQYFGGFDYLEHFPIKV